MYILCSGFFNITYSTERFSKLATLLEKREINLKINHLILSTDFINQNKICRWLLGQNGPETIIGHCRSLFKNTRSLSLHFTDTIV